MKVFILFFAVLFSLPLFAEHLNNYQTVVDECSSSKFDIPSGQAGVYYVKVQNEFHDVTWFDDPACLGQWWGAASFDFQKGDSQPEFYNATEVRRNENEIDMEMSQGTFKVYNDVQQNSKGEPLYRARLETSRSKGHRNIYNLYCRMKSLPISKPVQKVCR